MSESVAQAVKSGYDVIADNIRQGREAAARFRQGEYSFRDVPGDLEDVLRRLIQLGRELSATTFDVCEQLLSQAASTLPPDSRPAPPFRSPTHKPAPRPPASDAERMKLTVRFVGKRKAVAKTKALDRPRHPTKPEDLTATPLSLREPGGAAISKVTFETDVSVGGLIAVVEVPDDLAPGVYSGLVRAKHDEVPLGVLSVEIRK